MTKRQAYRLSPAMREALTRASREQHRSQSAQAAFYIAHGLKRDGYLVDAETTETNSHE